MQIGATTADLTQKLGRSPTPRELAEAIGCSVEEIVEGIESEQRLLDAEPRRRRRQRRRRRRLDARHDGRSTTTELEHIEIRESIKPLLEALPGAREADPAAALLPEQDPVGDRRRDRGQPDARLAAAEPDPRPAAQLAAGVRAEPAATAARRVVGVRERRRCWPGGAARPGPRPRPRPSTTATQVVLPPRKLQARPRNITWATTIGLRAQARPWTTSQAHGDQQRRRAARRTAAW